MKIAVFICNISSAISQSKLLCLFPFGLVLEKIGFWFEHETIMNYDLRVNSEMWWRRTLKTSFGVSVGRCG